MVLHLEEFQKEALLAYVQNVPAQREYKLRSILPQEPVDDINFAYNVVNGVYGAAASITGWNASSPLRDKKALEVAYGEVAKIQHGVRLDEKELLKFERPRSDAEKQRVIDYVYDTTDELVMGVDDTEEFLRAQAIYTLGLKYDDDVNDIHIDIQFDAPAGNKMSVTTPWSDPAAVPLADLQAGVTQFKSTNQRRRPVGMHMTSATEALLLQSEQIRTQIYGTNNGGRLLTSADVQNAFTALGLPAYEINDDVINIDGTETPLLEDGKVVMFGADLGQTMIGPVYENGFVPGKFTTPKIMQDPPGEAIIVGEAAFPALKRPQSIVILDVL